MAEEGNKLARKAIRSSYFSSIVSISLVLFLIGTLGAVVLNARIISNYLKENFQLTMIIKPEASEQEVKSFVITLNSSEVVKSAVLVTKEEAAKKLSEELGEDFVSFLGSNPLSNTIDVSFKADYADQISIESFVKTFGDFPFVQEVHYEHSLVDMINKNIRKISFVILGFSILLFFIAGALINNTIRISMYAKRLLIKSMQLVGATRNFIRKPFILKSVVSGLYSAIIANILLLGLLYFAQSEILLYSPEAALFRLQDLILLGLLMVSVIVLGIFISVLSTYMAVNKYLRMSYDELF